MNCMDIYTIYLKFSELSFVPGGKAANHHPITVHTEDFDFLALLDKSPFGDHVHTAAVNSGHPRGA